MSTFSNLRRALRVAVPHAMRRLEDQGGPTALDLIESAGFIQTCRDKKLLQAFNLTGRPDSSTARVFNGLVHALAVLSYTEDGITFRGETWDIRTTALPVSEVKDIPEHAVMAPDRLCGECGDRCDEHPFVGEFVDTSNQPFLRRLCCGWLVRLVV